MRLLSYRSERGVRAGALVEDDVVDVWDALGRAWEPSGSAGPQPVPTGLRAVLESEAPADVEAAVAAAEAGAQLDDVELLPPITDPQKIICIGLNYAAHAAEAGLDPPSVPHLLRQVRERPRRPRRAVPLPAASTKVDYEAEVAFVIGNRARRVDVERGARPRRRLHAAQRPLGA